MQFQCEILLDSVSPIGVRLTTMVCTYPRFIHSEIMTHRMFSRNSASSRAIPTKKMIDTIRADPIMPIEFGVNQPGMQASEIMEGPKLERCVEAWRAASISATIHAENLYNLGVHKQVVNRLLEPFMPMTTIITATDWANFFKLRIHPAAQPEMQEIARLMKKAMDESKPKERYNHRPYIKEADESGTTIEETFLISAARCARVSYTNHGKAKDILEDIAFGKKLQESGHWSPFEHQAKALDYRTYQGNFCGWMQFRKQCAGEYVYG